MVLCPICLEDIAHSYFSCVEIKNVWSYASTVPYIYIYIYIFNMGCLAYWLWLWFIFIFFVPCCQVKTHHCELSQTLMNIVVTVSSSTYICLSLLASSRHMTVVWKHIQTLVGTIPKEKSNKMQQCIKILLFHIYMKLDMFRATHCPSSGA